MSALRRDGSAQAVATGISAALLGYASSVAVMVAGLTAAGASAGQVGSGLLALGAVMAVASVALSAGLRLPIAVVWSTPGLALLVGVGPLAGGFGVVVAGFLVAGLLTVLTGLVGPLVRALGRLPVPLTAAVLGGVLLPFCLAPARAVADLPLEAGAIVLAWAVALRLAPRWAAPVALGALVVVTLLLGLELPTGGAALPRLELVAPVLSWEAVTRVALPLYLVTMAAQNLVGLSVLTSFGYRPPVGVLLTSMGGASLVGAPFGSPTVNLAAITGALTAGPTAHEDPARRWVATATGGVSYLGLAVLAPLTSAVVTRTDPRLVATAAGLALVGAFAGAVTTALSQEGLRTAAAVALLVTASGTSLAGLGPAVLGLLAGGAVALLQTPRPG